MVEAPLPLAGLTAAELEGEAQRRLTRGAGAWLKIWRRALYDGRFEPEACGLSAEAADQWRRAFSFELLTVLRVESEPTELGPDTKKAVLATRDGMEIECVSIPMAGGRSTLCVSSQVGCRLGCRFCETGRMGLLRDLRAHEIVGQVLTARHRLGWAVDNVVFMGMGEPLDNVDELLRALRALNDRRGLHIGQQRLRVTTAGSVEGIRRLGELGWKRMDLSLSLNAATDEQRSRLMPINKLVPLAALQDALRAYPRRPSFVLGINYCLLPGLNDAREDARGVREFCAPLERVLVNLIPYNPGTAPITRPPTEEEIVRFLGWLKEEGLPVRRRITKGRSVMAACGQLGDPALRRRIKARLAVVEDPARS